jgi:hypothetical protein
MQPQLNPAPLPRPEVAPGGAPQPAVRRRKGHPWLLLLSVIVLSLLGWYAWRQWSPAARSGAQAVARVRTAAVVQGSVEKTLRLAGTTTAEKYVSLIAPQLRGGRGGGVSVNVARGGGGMVVTIDVSGGGGMGGMGGGGAGAAVAAGPRDPPRPLRQPRA